MPYTIVPIVEGHGEVASVPILLRRLIAEFDLGVPLEIGRPIRQSRGTLIKAEGVERAVGLAILEMGETGAIFILLDSEGDCPRDLADSLLARSQNTRADNRISVVLAHREFEAWFLASASSLRGSCGLPDDIEDHPEPESVQDCKGWLERYMPVTSKYSETRVQPAFTAQFNFDLARNSRSFQKLRKEFLQICTEAKSLEPR